MDPNANLREQLTIARRIQDLSDRVASGELHPGDAVLADPDGPDRLVELVLALDEWIRNGGALPKRWERK